MCDAPSLQSTSLAQDFVLGHSLLLSVHVKFLHYLVKCSFCHLHLRDECDKCTLHANTIDRAEPLQNCLESVRMHWNNLKYLGHWSAYPGIDAWLPFCSYFRTTAPLPQPKAAIPCRTTKPDNAASMSNTVSKFSRVSRMHSKRTSLSTSREPIISIKEFGHCIKRFWDPATCIVWNVWISRPTTLDLAYAHVCKNAVQIATSWCTLPAASEVNVSIFIHIFFWGSRHKPQRRSQGVCFLSLAEYTLACLSTMFLGYLFRHCFVIFVPLFWDFLSLFLGNFCP